MFKRHESLSLRSLTLSSIRSSTNRLPLYMLTDLPLASSYKRTQFVGQNYWCFFFGHNLTCFFFCCFYFFFFFFDVVIVAAVVWLLFELYNHFTLYFFGLIFALHSIHYFIACIEEFTRPFFHEASFSVSDFQFVFCRNRFFSSFWILPPAFCIFSVSLYTHAPIKLYNRTSFLRCLAI